MCVPLRHLRPSLCPSSLSLFFPVRCRSSAAHRGVFLHRQGKAARFLLAGLGSLLPTRYQVLGKKIHGERSKQRDPFGV